jgi:hypothetical protein
MTEAEWLACADPKKLLKRLHRRTSERKRRLFAIACCRRVWQHFRGPQCHACLEVAERYADGAAGADEISTAEEAAMAAYSLCRDAGDRTGTPAADAVYGATCTDVGWDLADFSRTGTLAAVVAAVPPVEAKATRAAELAAQLELVRCVFGNSFRPVTVDPHWLTATVRQLAAGIYEERAFDRLPILADALQDAGCNNDDILNHCREPGEHVRGCWVVDLLLGKG